MLILFWPPSADTTTSDGTPEVCFTSRPRSYEYTTDREHTYDTKKRGHVYEERDR